MKKSSFNLLILCVLFISLIATLAACGKNEDTGNDSGMEFMPSESDGDIPSTSIGGGIAVVIPGGTVPDGVEFYYDSNGNLVMINPDGEHIIIGSGEIDSTGDGDTSDETTDAPKNMVTLPDGSEIEEDKVIYLDDGAMAIPYQTRSGIWGHKTFFTDGTYALSDYSDSTGTLCEYKDSYTIDVTWYAAENYALKKECLRTSDLFVFRRDEYEYETESGDDGAVIRYAVATNTSGYDEENGSYFKWRSEYGPLHGPEKPYKSITYDYETGKMIYLEEYEYDFNGTLKRAKYYNENNILTQHDGYTDGKITVQYLFDGETGEKTWEILFEDYDKYLRISETQYYSDGSKYSIFFKDGKRVQSESTKADKSYNITIYDSNENATVTSYYDTKGNYTGKTFYEKVDTHGKDRELHYDKDDVLDYIYEYTGNETGEYLIYTSYYKNGNVHIFRAYDIDYNILREEWYDIDGNKLS